MNRLTIIGNLTRDPETRTTGNGSEVCNFTVAVNRRQKDQNGQDIADFFRVGAWKDLGKSCQKYLKKGKKVAVVGPVSINVFTDKDGNAAGSLNVVAQEVEFLSPKDSQENGDASGTAQTASAPAGYTPVEGDELPF